MTEKQENILKAALKLFAENGYASTSTSKVAKAAGVSEGLIFRHFGNKEGLLNSIRQMANESLEQKMAPILMTADPKEMLRKFLELPLQVEKADYEMWRLLYALKWQTNSYDSSANEPIRVMLKEAFKKLGYKDPLAEAELVLTFMDGMVTAILLHEPDNKEDIINSLKDKYNI